MDDNVPPANTLLVVEALTKANKSYDLVRAYASKIIHFLSSS